MSPTVRRGEWESKRVFFLTPQVLANDLKNSMCWNGIGAQINNILEICDPRSIVCIVVDEAHKASGKYAYCSVVREISSHTRHFRVLALSATPGGKLFT